MKIALVDPAPCGLALALLLARTHRVHVLHPTPESAALTQAGQPPLDDPQVPAYLQSHHGLLSLQADTLAHEALKAAVFVIVNAPHSGSAAAAHRNGQGIDAQLGRILIHNPSAVVVVQATVPLGFTARMRQQHRHPAIFHSPSLATPGQALQDSLCPPRIVVGARTPLAEAYAHLVHDNTLHRDMPVLFCGSSESEATALLWQRPPEQRRAPHVVHYAQQHQLNPRELLDGLGLGFERAASAVA